MVVEMRPIMYGNFEPDNLIEAYDTQGVAILRRPHHTVQVDSTESVPGMR